MAHLKDFINNQLSGNESSSLSKVKTRDSFCKWLHKRGANKNFVASYVYCIDRASSYLTLRRISLVDLWELTSVQSFQNVYNRAVNDKSFRAAYRKTYTDFIKVGEAFLEFLKERSIKESPILPAKGPRNFDSPFTIREAIVHVLKSERHGLTIEQIYNKITAQGLYSFGAQNPLNVVRVEIDRACKNTNYSIRAKHDLFRYGRNQNGDRVYFLLQPSERPEEDSHMQYNVDSWLSGIVDLQEGIKGIREILNAHFLTLYGYSNIHLLWNAAQNSLPMFLNDNAINTPTDLWQFLLRAFGNELVLDSPHIWIEHANFPHNAKGLVINLARHIGGIVSRQQIEEYFSKIGLPAPTNSALINQGHLLFYDSSKFILSEIVNFTTERRSLISQALYELFSSENVPYIILRDIAPTWFSFLPELPNGLQWTQLLLQEALRAYPDIGYRTIFSGLKGQSLDTLGAAIVPCESAIESFADVVHMFCFSRYNLPFRLPAEQLRLALRKAGMLDGNELIFNMHKALRDHRFAFSDQNRTVMILER